MRQFTDTADNGTSSGLKRACVEYNSTYAHFTTRIDRATRPSGWGIKGGCLGRKCLRKRLPCAHTWRPNSNFEKEPANTQHLRTLL